MAGKHWSPELCSKDAAPHFLEVTSGGPSGCNKSVQCPCKPLPKCGHSGVQCAAVSVHILSESGLFKSSLQTARMSWRRRVQASGGTAMTRSLLGAALAQIMPCEHYSSWSELCVCACVMSVGPPLNNVTGGPQSRF